MINLLFLKYLLIIIIEFIYLMCLFLFAIQIFNLFILLIGFLDCLFRLFARYLVNLLVLFTAKALCFLNGLTLLATCLKIFDFLLLIQAMTYRTLHFLMTFPQLLIFLGDQILIFPTVIVYLLNYRLNLMIKLGFLLVITILFCDLKGPTIKLNFVRLDEYYRFIF